MDPILEGLTSLAALSVLVLTLTESVTKFVAAQFKKQINGGLAWLTSAVIGLVLGNIGSYFALGMFADPAVSPFAWYWTGSLVGLVSTLVANGVFGTEVAKALLTFLKIRVPIDKGKK